MGLLRGETSFKKGPMINQVQEKLTLDWIILASNNRNYREISMHLFSLQNMHYRTVINTKC